MREIGVGIIGFGFMGKAHTYGYKTMPLYYRDLPFKIRLVGVCSRTLATAEKAKEELGFEFATDDLDELLACKDIQIVNICTPNLYHKEQILKALKAGKHVYCDKPLTVTYSEAQEVLQLTERSGLIHQVALQNRFFPSTMRAKELIQEGRLGRILSFRACYLHSGSVDPQKPFGWKQDKAMGGGVLVDLGSHVLDLLYHLLGEYASIMARTQIIYNRRPDREGRMMEMAADDAVYMIATMKNGSVGTIEASKIATGTNDELRVEIHGDQGALRFNLMDPNWLEFYDNKVSDTPHGGTKGFTRIECVQRFEKPGGDFPPSKLAIGWIRAHAHCLYHFVNCVYEGRQASPSFEEGAYIQYIMEKAYESACENKWVTLK